MSEPKPRPRRSPLDRRSFLQIGGLAMGGLGLGDLLRAREASASPFAPPPDTSVIFVWLPGGPPHMETYDMKPDAPSDYRGTFVPRRTNVPGMQVCELLPRHARCADKFTLIRSVHHEFSDHGGGHKRFLTARRPKEPTGFVNDAPMIGSFINRALERGRKPGELPDYIALIRKGRDRVDTFSFGAAWLGAETTPFIVNGDPNEKAFKIDNLSLAPGMAERLEDRETLLHGFDRLRKDVDGNGQMGALDAFNRKALDLLTSDAVRRAFDLSGEPEKLRDRYGRHAWGQRLLLARRLVEAGSRFVTVVVENPYVSGITMPSYGTYNWDSHAVNCHLFDDARIRLPLYDQVVTALIEDLYQRGLDRKVLLVVTGEFGRTPKLSQTVGSQSGVLQPGRDHWPRAMSMLLSGGGMQTGQVVGSTDARGEDPVDRPLSPNDLWATILHHLGIDPNLTFPDPSGRPVHILPEGEPIRECLPVH